MMKKYLMMGVTAVTLLATSCQTDLYDPSVANPQATKSAEQQYNEAFIKVFGEPDANQTWGFGKAVIASRMTRSMAEPAVRDITAPYDETWVASYLPTATEPNSTNVYHNTDNSYSWAEEGYWTDPVPAVEGGYKKDDFNWTVMNSVPWGSDDKAWMDEHINPYWSWDFAYYGVETQDEAWAKVVELILAAGHQDWLNYTEGTPGKESEYVVTKEAGEWKDPDWVTNFKITNTWSGGIAVAASEGSAYPGCERTIVVTGTWNLTEDQRIGSLGKVIVANGGTINISEGKSLSMVNQSRLVVLRGGKITGTGNIFVTNGNADDFENYNAGTIELTGAGTFNNNFGKFFNYGTVKVANYASGGSGEGVMTNGYYNHGLTIVNNAEALICRNARVFNACQFYVTGNMQLYILEQTQGAAFIVDGELLCNSGEDGSNDPTYVGLEAGALVKCNTLRNQGTSWVGPTENGYAVLDIEDKITYLNWEQEHPENGGYFANNIYVCAGDWSNVPDGNGYHQGDEDDEYNHSISTAEYKFKNIVANAVGNGNVTIAEKGDEEVIPADQDFELGVKGCTPGFKIKKEDPDVKPSLHVMAEDLSAREATDFDFNDCVIDVFYVDENTVDITLLAAGGTLPLRINEDDNWEVHKLFDVDVTCMVNTGRKYHVAKAPYSQANRPYVYLTLTGKTWSMDQDEFAAQVRDQIKLEVFKENENGVEEWIELKATQGAPAGKVATPVNIYMYDSWYDEIKNDQYRWTWEKQSMGKEFGNWVTDPNVKWYRTKE